MYYRLGSSLLIYAVTIKQPITIIIFASSTVVHGVQRRTSSSVGSGRAGSSMYNVSTLLSILSGGGEIG